MIVYRTAGEPIEPQAECRDLERRAAAYDGSASSDQLITLFIDAAEVEAAVADAVFGASDGLDGRVERLERVTDEAARAVVRAWRDGDRKAAIDGLGRVTAAVPADALPRSAVRRVSEGYAYYALHPETYAAAAVRFAQTVRPRRVVCIGIRTIGAGLAAIVSAACESDGVLSARATVRPRGHPFNRQLAVRDDLRNRLLQDCAATHYAVVDEGPGLSGSSFASVVSWLVSQNVSPDRIHLFPSWVPDAASLRSTEAQRVWARHTKWHVSADDAGAGLSRVLAGRSGQDLSAGSWRRMVYASEELWPAAMPRHERVKALVPDEQVIVRFSGLGRYGLVRRARAAALADAGLGVQPGTLCEGYLTLPVVAGRPCTAADADEGMLECAARQIALPSRAFPARRSPGLDALHAMVEQNLSELDPSLPAPAFSTWRSVLASAPAVELDGRVQTHEWIRAGASIVKVDALDHASDHFFPGTQDVAWDLAGVEAEFSLDAAHSRFLTDAYRRLSGDHEVLRRLPYYRVAYAAFQAGYAACAAQWLEDPEEVRRFELRKRFFVERVRALAAVRASQ